VPSRFHVLLAFAGVVALLSCGSAPHRIDVRPLRGHMKVSENVNVVAAADTAIVASALRFVGSIHTRPASVVASPHAPTTVLPTNSVGDVPCGGDLPPCWRVTIESRGQWDAYNPTGCGGNGCYGPYQFSGAWAGNLGLPLDLSQTTHAQWVAAARELWANGAGCSNWSAC